MGTLPSSSVINLNHGFRSNRRFGERFTRSPPELKISRSLCFLCREQSVLRHRSDRVRCFGVNGEDGDEKASNSTTAVEDEKENRSSGGDEDRNTEKTPASVSSRVFFLKSCYS
ncbi:hypothetical protein QJS10_CPB15g02132 [Acorus calamus]|uniref:Uncharacterized protein n=1 Tax=Acorus calamus TaxID=4465 RepID=A0AAV9D5C0_ACOCL|nr:hypothetical protein QJS10_CPB15g02132 [Acorus calamus]